LELERAPVESKAPGLGQDVRDAAHVMRPKAASTASAFSRSISESFSKFSSDSGLREKTGTGQWRCWPTMVS